METEELIPERIRKIAEYLPQTESFSVRLDANESPFLPSENILCKFSEAVREIEFDRYPDPYAKELIEAFAKRYCLKPENVIAGNGSDELISLIISGFASDGDRVAVTFPEFSMYSFYAQFAGAEVCSFGKTDAKLDIDSFISFVEEEAPSVVILSNPCNPTGQIIRKNELIKLVESANCLVVIDEAYMEFSPDDESLLGEIEKFPNLIVLKTLSKAIGVAGLRIGFAASNTQLVSAIRKIKSPYNLNAVSQRFGSIMLSAEDELDRRVSQIRELTCYLKDRLEQIDSDRFDKIYETYANFVYIKMTSADEASKLHKALKDKGIAIRNMGDGHIRITAGTKEEIDTLIEKMKEILK